jgi:uncharacterized membrane protein YfcA
MDRTTLTLAAVAFLVGAFNILVGPTGGVMAGATAALVPPPASLLLHAGVSWWSSLWRCVVLRDSIMWRVVLRFALPALPATFLALLFGVHVSSPAWRIAIACYLVAWALSSQVRTLLARQRSVLIASLIAGVASVVVGAGGVVAMPAIRSATESLEQAIATEAALTVVQNTLKIVMLSLVLHVSLANHAQHLVTMALSASLGLAVGRRTSLKIPAATKDHLLTATLLAVAGWLFFSALR